MRRAWNALSRYVVNLVGSTVRGWNAFFFTPADPTALGVIRLCVGALSVWSVLNLALDLHDTVGADSWANADLIRYYFTTRGKAAVWSFWFWVPDRMLWPVWAIYLTLAVLFTIGLYTRITAVLLWLAVIGTLQRSPVTIFGFDAVMSTLLFYLVVFGAGGQAVSIDRLLARRRSKKPGPPLPTVSANLSLRMIQLHLCLIYASSGLAKLQGPAWWDGSALEYILITPEYRVFDLTWLLYYQSFLHICTHFVLFLEIIYPVLVWAAEVAAVGDLRYCGNARGDFVDLGAACL